MNTLRIWIIPVLIAANPFFVATHLIAQNSSANSTPTAPTANFDSRAATRSWIAWLHKAWMKEHDPARRRDLAGQLVEEVIHDYGEQPVEIADEVARDGAPKNELVMPSAVRTVTLDPVISLKGTHRGEEDYPLSPVFRRISKHRIEAWTKQEGWLFNEGGQVVADVQVPRRDGAGREWFGAFLPNGNWITTDLWENDRQLNCYNSKGKWLWELEGSQMVDQLPKDPADTGSLHDPVEPSIGWARADNTGRRWLVCLGTDFFRGYVRVDLARHIEPLSYTVDVWGNGYPRSMGVRGTYLELFIDSDDGREALHRSEAPHGAGVGWPSYSLSDRLGVVINGGNDFFGFWPDSHRVYIESERSMQEPHQVWFFDDEGRYEGEMPGSYLGDSANGGNLLIQGADGGVGEVSHDKPGLTICNVRSFKWPNGTQAVPLAIYDDLSLGFFLRGPGLIGFNDDSRRARQAAEIVLARWSN